jgi:hypothetical protein
MEKFSLFLSEKSQKVSNFFKSFFVKKSRVDLIEFREFLGAEKLFNFCGYQLLPRAPNRGDKFRKAHFILSQIVGILIIILAMISAFVYAKENIEVTTENVCYVFSYSSTLLRFLYMLTKSQQLIEIIEKLDEHFPHLSLDQKSFGVRKYLKELKMVSKIVVFVFVFAVAQFTNFNIEVKIYGWLMSKEVEWIPMHVFWFPFDASKPLIFWIVQVGVKFLLFGSHLIRVKSYGKFVNKLF